jgi:hypothetical protein
MCPKPHDVTRELESQTWITGEKQCMGHPKFGSCKMGVSEHGIYPKHRICFEDILIKRKNYLVGGFKHLFFPFHIWVVILPIDELTPSFFKMVKLHHQADIHLYIQILL